MAKNYHDPSELEFNKMDIDPAFPFFPLLPKELRDMVWSYTFTFIPARTIEVHSTTRIVPMKCECGNCRALKQFIPAIKRAPVPQIFQVCSESRQRAAKEFPLEFGGLLADGPIFFDFKKDTLLFHDTEAWCAFNRMLQTAETHEVIKPSAEHEAILKRFREEARFIAIKTCMWLHTSLLCGEFYRLKELALLYDSWRYWPSNPSFNTTTRGGRVPLTIPSEDQRLRTSITNETNLRRIWSENAEKTGVVLTEFPIIKYKNLEEMETSMGEEA